MSFEWWFYEEPYTIYGGTRADVVFHSTDEKPKHMGYDQVIALLKEAWEMKEQ